MFDLDEIRVTSRRPESREAFAEQLRAELSTPVVVTESAAETIDGADIAVEATRLREPASLIAGDLLAPGSLLVPYGTISALDPDLLDVDRQGGRRRLARGAGRQLRRAAAAPALGRADPRHACTPSSARSSPAREPGRENDDERILFWHRGLSILDVAVGHLILERAEAADLGTMVRFR